MHRTIPPKRSWGLVPGAWAALLLVCASAVAFGYGVWHQRQEALTDAQQATRLHATSLEDSLTQALRVMELTAGNSTDDATSTTHAGAGTASLQAAIRYLPFVRSLSVADGQGRIVASSNPANVGVQADLQALYPLGNPEVALLRLGRSTPGRDWADRPKPGEAEGLTAFVPTALPHAAPGGTLWLLATLNTDHFVNQAKSLFGETPLTAHWVRYDGQLLWSTDPNFQGDQTKALAFQVGQWIAEAEAGSLYRPAGHSHEAALVSYRTSSRFPAAVVVTWDEESALQDWQAGTKVALLVVVPLLLALGVGTWLLNRRQLQLQDREAELAEERLLASRVFDSSSDAVLVTAPDGAIVSVNPAFEQLTGYTAAEVLGQNPRMLGSGLHPKSFFEAVWQSVLASGHWQGQVTNRQKSGRLYQAQVSINAILNAEGDITHLAGVLRDVTEAQRLQTALQDSEQRMALALQGGNLAYWDWDLHTDQVQVNARWCEMLGLEPRSAWSLSEWEGRVHPDDRTAVSEALQNHLNGGAERYHCEHRLLHADGHWVWVLDTGRVTARDPEGKPERMVGTHLDLSARKLAEEKMQLAASVFNHAQEAIVVTDPRGIILDVNDAFARITGYDRSEVLGRNTSMLSSGQQDKTFYQAMWADLHQHHRWSGEIWNRRKTGEVYAELLTISAVENEAGQVVRYVALFSDITQLKEHERQLERIAHFDALTGLPNRVLLSDRLQQAMSRARRSGKALAVVFLDLDGFKAVNDTHGHALGDQLLIHLAQRMKQALRTGDTLARLGGDEFVAVLQDLDDHEACVPVLERLRDAASMPLGLSGSELKVSASLGLAFYPQPDEVDADQLLRQADQAMYQAKLAGKNRYHVFDAQQDRTLRHRHESLEGIRLALERSEFVLHYQPKVNMRTGQVVGMEALVRWQHPQRGLLSPAAFLPTMENHRLALELGRWVLGDALRQMAEWKTQGLQMRVSVNLDAQQLQDHSLVNDLQGLLRAHPSALPGDLQLEVLETTALNDIQLVSDVMSACEKLGVHFALDDFGTGYSSLTYLRRLPARVLKIDQSFVRDMLDDADDLAILQGILGLARAFRRDVVAEGVETVAHGQMLLRMGCEHGQGYAIARPMPAAEVPAWCASWRPDPSWLQLARVPSDDLPVLFAVAEHRGWLNAMRKHLESGLPHTPPPLDHHGCAFGHWLLELPPQHRYRTMPAFPRMEALHQQLHQQAGLLAASWTPGHPLPDDHAGWARLQGVSDALQEELLHLMDQLLPPVH